jgi:hypothetical protein
MGVSSGARFVVGSDFVDLDPDFVLHVVMLAELRVKAL